MAQIVVSTDDGEVVEIFNTRQYDLTRDLGRIALDMDILEAVSRAARIYNKAHGLKAPKGAAK